MPIYVDLGVMASAPPPTDARNAEPCQAKETNLKLNHSPEKTPEIHKRWMRQHIKIQIFYGYKELSSP